MKIHPFTNEGLQALLEELYLLESTKLEVQSKQILLDFNNWVSDHIMLSQEQLKCLSQLNPRMLALIANQVSSAVLNKLPMRLTKTSGERMKAHGKIAVYIRYIALASLDSQGDCEATGSVEITVAIDH